MEAPVNFDEESESSYVLYWDEEENDRLIRSKKLYLAKEKSKLFKQIIRMGISNIYRPEIYLSLVCKDKMVEDLRPFWPDVITQSSNPKYNNVIKLFGYPNYELFVQQPFLVNFLTIIKNQNTEIKFSPMIPCVASILLLYYDEFLSYIILQSMINESIENDKYFVMNKKKFISMLTTIESIIQINKKELYDHSKSINLDFSIISLFILPVLFSKKMNKNIVLTIFDSFMHEGRSVLIRFIIGFIIDLESELLQTSSPSDFMTSLLKHITSLRHPSDIQRITSLAFGTDYTKRNRINPIEKTKRMDDHFLNDHIKSHLPNFEDFYRFYSNSNNTYCGRPSNRIRIDRMLYSKVNGGQLITGSQFYDIKKKLHPSFLHLNAYPIFRLSEDGTSFVPFLKKAKNVSSCMLVIKASSGTIGAVLANSIEPFCKKKSSGSPLTTVFELNNMKTYSYSRKNEYFLHVTRDSVTIGMGGNAGSAIYFGDGFDTVVSEACETFDSPPLLKSKREKIENVELYKLAP